MRWAQLRGATCSVLFACTTFGCGGDLRLTPPGPWQGTMEESVVADYPPPPAKVEELPPDPGEPCVWQDGFWTWENHQWSWQEGRWVIPPTGCYRTKPALLWFSNEEGSRVRYWQPRWFPNNPTNPTCHPQSCQVPTNAP